MVNTWLHSKMQGLHHVKLTTKISKNLSWVARYLRRAKHSMPKMVLPKQIRSHKPFVTKEQRTYGTCSISDKIITIATHRIVIVKVGKRKKRKRIAIPQKEILMTLAHELAHLRYDPHGYEQESYAGIIFNAMSVKERCPTCKGTGKVLVRYVN